MDNQIKNHKEYIKHSSNIDKYVNQLNDKEKIALNIAIEYLGSSFSVIKSTGYCKWIAKETK